MLLRASGAVIALALFVPQPAPAQPAGGRVRMIANPSALIGADIATAQAMRAKGAREGLAGSMAEGAEVVVPPRQAAEPLLRRKEGAPLHPHQPDAAWIACDGSYGITRGRWGDAGQGSGWYATVWQRHPKKGYYQWRLTLEGAAASLPDAPEFLVGLVADCPAHPDAPRPGSGGVMIAHRPSPPRTRPWCSARWPGRSGRRCTGWVGQPDRPIQRRQPGLARHGARRWQPRVPRLAVEGWHDGRDCPSGRAGFTRPRWLTCCNCSCLPSPRCSW
jgi:hypothetical protein